MLSVNVAPVKDPFFCRDIAESGGHDMQSDDKTHARCAIFCDVSYLVVHHADSCVSISHLQTLEGGRDTIFREMH